MKTRARRVLGGVVEDLGLRMKATASGDGMFVVRLDDSREKVGEVWATGDCTSGGWAHIGIASISSEYRGKGLYPVMLKTLRDVAQKHGCKGVLSEGSGREGIMSTRAWEKFAEKEPRVRRAGDDYYLSALPKTGRIPMTTVRRAMKALGRKVKSCGITPAALRIGMEVEREHRDVTRGGMTATAKIAAAHLCEDGRYYVELKKLEKRLKRRK